MRSVGASALLAHRAPTNARRTKGVVLKFTIQYTIGWGFAKVGRFQFKLLKVHTMQKLFKTLKVRLLKSGVWAAR